MTAPPAPGRLADATPPRRPAVLVLEDGRAFHGESYGADGETFGEADLRRDLLRIVALLKICHRDVGPRLKGNAGFFDVFDVIRRYVRLLSEGGSSFSPDLPRTLERVGALEAAQMAMPIVFGHNDLLPGNLLDATRQLAANDALRAGFGETPDGDYLDYFVEVKQREVQAAHEQITSWELERYLQLF